MTNRTYPRVSFEAKKKWRLYADTGRTGPKCACCAEPATGVSIVETSWFRGEDEMANVCSRDAHSAQAILNAIEMETHNRRAAHAEQLRREQANRERKLSAQAVAAVDSTMGALK